MPETAEQKLLKDWGGDPSGCWLWTGSRTRDGYGLITTREGGKQRRSYVHRIAYVKVHGFIPDGLEIDHLCRVRNCFNPSHLEAVTHAENLRRAQR